MFNDLLKTPQCAQTIFTSWQVFEIVLYPGCQLFNKGPLGKNLTCFTVHTSEFMNEPILKLERVFTLSVNNISSLVYNISGFYPNIRVYRRVQRVPRSRAMPGHASSIKIVLFISCKYIYMHFFWITWDTYWNKNILILFFHLTVIVFLLVHASFSLTASLQLRVSRAICRAQCFFVFFHYWKTSFIYQFICVQ